MRFNKKKRYSDMLELPSNLRSDSPSLSENCVVKNWSLCCCINTATSAKLVKTIIYPKVWSMTESPEQKTPNNEKYKLMFCVIYLFLCLCSDMIKKKIGIL